LAFDGPSSTPMTLVPATGAGGGGVAGVAPALEARLRALTEPQTTRAARIFLFIDFSRVVGGLVAAATAILAGQSDFDA
jgi:hypothetical protein